MSKKEDRDRTSHDKEVADDAAGKLLALIEMVSAIENIPIIDIRVSLFMMLCKDFGGTMSITNLAPWMIATVDEFAIGYLNDKLEMKRTDDPLKFAKVLDATVKAIVSDMFTGLLKGKYMTMSEKLLKDSKETVNEFVKQAGSKGEKANDK